MRLSEEFLGPYYAKGDCFPDLLARCTYLTKYCRDGETWTDTIRRVVQANCARDPYVTLSEAEALFDAFWNMRALPPGRGLWTGGVYGIPAAAVYNCHYTTIRSLEDWCFCADQLMLGGGVGVGLGELDKLPSVVSGVTTFRLACRMDHPDVDEVKPDVSKGSLLVEDSRTGWIDALRAVLVYAFNGLSLTLDIGHIRSRGTPISTFGGVACGPGPLAKMLRSIWDIIRGAQGRKLNSVEALDITNFIGLCVKSGNVRRSALIVLGEADDQAFRDAKKDYVAVLSHRHTSNNSIVLRTAEDVANLDTRQLVEDAAVYGEPGVLNLHLIQQTDPNARGINPCYRADTLVHTRQGHFQIKDLVGKTVDVWDGERWRSAFTFEKTSENEKMLKFTLQDGSHFAVTEYHGIILEDGTRVEAKDVPVGTKLRISNAPLAHGTIEEPGAYIKGFMVGDGTYYEDRPILWLYPPKYGCAERLIESCRQLPYEMGYRSDAIIEPGFKRNKTRAIMQGLTVRPSLVAWSSEYKKRLPKDIFSWSLSSKLEFIAGVMDADGTAADTKNGFMYQVCSIEKVWLIDFQTLLKTVGVYSKLSLMKKAGRKDFNDGYGEYESKDCWRLTVSQNASIQLASQVRFSRLIDLSRKKTEYKISTRWNKVVSIEPDGMDAEVFCLVTDEFDRIACTNGLLIGRCGEIPLHDHEACNLAEFFPARSQSPEDDLRLLTRYAIRQRLVPVTDPEADATRTKNMRIGVGLGGICDSEIITYNLSSWYAIVRDTADAYATTLGIARPVAVTTVKPSGTISLLNGSSPGMHAPYAPYFLRRVRISKLDKMAPAMIAAGVPYEDCVYDQTKQTWVFSFPCAKLNAMNYVVKENVFDQVRRQAWLQEHWADNAVSATISFREDEKIDLAVMLAGYLPKLKSTSCLPKAHGYAQAPYEEIDQSTYESLISRIDMSAKLVHGGDAEIEECEGGVCPVR